MKVRLVTTASECQFKTPSFETQAERIQRAMKEENKSTLFGALKKSIVDAGVAMKLLEEGKEVKEVANQYGVGPRAVRRQILKRNPSFFKDLEERRSFAAELAAESSITEEG